jgi:Luciferase-like monooxygenase
MNAYACSFPENAVRIAQLAEAARFESLWAGEHVVLPDPRTPESRMAPEERILDPVVMPTYLAAHTQQVLLGTGIIILPQRNPLLRRSDNYSRRSNIDWDSAQGYTLSIENMFVFVGSIARKKRYVKDVSHLWSLPSHRICAGTGWHHEPDGSV